MLIVWFFMGSYPFGNKSLMAGCFCEKDICFFCLFECGRGGDISFY